VVARRARFDKITLVSTLLELFPAGSTTDPDGMLVIGGCRADDLAGEFGTPVLVVAEDALRARAREYADELTSRWPNSRVVFASKSFPCTAVQRVMVTEGLGLDVAGGGEILSGIRAGVDPALIVLHGNAKSDEEIAMAVQHRVGLIVVDGPDDVDRLEALVPIGAVQDVLIRVIPGVTADTHQHVLTGHEGSKFGVLPDQARDLIRRIEASSRIRLQGLPPSRSRRRSLRWRPSASFRSTISAAGWAPATRGRISRHRWPPTWTC
jgi:diaminopimelate decarboxylase